MIYTLFELTIKNAYISKTQILIHNLVRIISMRIWKWPFEFWRHLPTTNKIALFENKTEITKKIGLKKRAFFNISDIFSKVQFYESLANAFEIRMVISNTHWNYSKCPLRNNEWNFWLGNSGTQKDSDLKWFKFFQHFQMGWKSATECCK